MIYFFYEEIKFKLKNKRLLKKWIEKILSNHHIRHYKINYVFCNDSYLLGINKQYLQHDFLTDIITFDNSEVSNHLESDIFISIDRINENATTLKETFEEELHRVMIHGLLHLLGFKDKTSKQKEIMRAKENECLSLKKNYYIR